MLAASLHIQNDSEHSPYQGGSSLRRIQAAIQKWIHRGSVNLLKPAVRLSKGIGNTNGGIRR